MDTLVTTVGTFVKENLYPMYHLGAPGSFHFTAGTFQAVPNIRLINLNACNDVIGTWTLKAVSWASHHLSVYYVACAADGLL